MNTTLIDGTLDRFDWFLLSTLFAAAAKDESEGYLTVDSLKIRDPRQSDAKAIKERLDNLEQKRLVVCRDATQWDGQSIADDLFRLTPEGICFVILNVETLVDQQYGLTEDIPDESVEPVWNIAQWLREVSPSDSIPLHSSEIDQTPTSAPASDRLVSINHNSKEFTDAIASLEETIRAFRDDHHLDNVIGQEKKVLVSALENGKRLLDDTSIRIDAAFAFLVEPLRILARRYDQAVVGALAAAAITAILKLLGFN